METEGRAPRVATYLRVSTDEQAERGTIENQRHFLRNFADLYQLNVVGTYEDDGYPGTLLLKDRPGGRRLLEDAKAGHFDEVIVYRLDRLARKLTVLLDSHSALEGAGVSVRSATEPFDTGTPVGRLMFQLLGSIAEWEKASIAERTMQGRDRVVRTGKWTKGPIPTGYEIGADRYLVPSTRQVAALGITEAEMVIDLFKRIAAGSSATAEAARLQALGIGRNMRYSTGKVLKSDSIWWVGRVASLIHNPIYKGLHVFNARGGAIERSMPVLVAPQLWQAANDRLIGNRDLSKKGTDRLYLLRGLIICSNCGANYTGTTCAETRYYRCGGSHGKGRALKASNGACHGKMIPAQRLEDAVWQECHNFIMDPGEPLAEAQRQLRERMGQSTTAEAERRALLQRLSDHEGERERVMTLFRRGRITLEEADQQLEAAAREVADVRALLDSIAAQGELLKAWEGRVTDITTMLARLRERLEQIEETNDVCAKREVIELLVRQIVVHTDDSPARKRKRGSITAYYVFGKPRAVDYSSARSGSGQPSRTAAAAFPARASPSTSPRRTFARRGPRTICPLPWASLWPLSRFRHPSNLRSSSASCRLMDRSAIRRAFCQWSVWPKNEA